MTTKNEMAEQAAEMIGSMLLRLHSETGLPLDCILAGAHAQVITMMTTTVNLHSKLTHRDHLKMTHPGGSKAHRRAAPI